MEAIKRDQYRKVAKVVVEEINSLDRLNSMFELGMRVSELIDPGKVGSFGLGCGGRCDSFGLGCGNKCGQGLDWNEELIRSRFAIDVMGKRGLTDDDMAVIRRDFIGFHEVAMGEIKEKLSLEAMRSRIGRYSKK